MCKRRAEEHGDVGLILCLADSKIMRSSEYSIWHTENCCVSRQRIKGRMEAIDYGKDTAGSALFIHGVDAQAVELLLSLDSAFHTRA